MIVSTSGRPEVSETNGRRRILSQSQLFWDVKEIETCGFDLTLGALDFVRLD